MSSLDQLKKDIEFTTPDFYFENLETVVLTKIKKQEIRARNKKIFISISSIAASFLLLFTIFNFTASQEMDTLVSDNSQTPTISVDVIDEQHTAKQEPEPEILLAMATPATASSSPKNAVHHTAKHISSVANVEMLQDDNFNNLDYQIIEYYEDEMLLTDINTYIYMY